jgi:UDP-3-O-[3-hydroxymyristoyl] glucosamine N-acyltransferase
VQVGGQAAIAGHISIGKAARICAQAGVMSDVPAGTELVGSPVQARREFFRQVAVLKRMTRRQP